MLQFGAFREERMISVIELLMRLARKTLPIIMFVPAAQVSVASAADTWKAKLELIAERSVSSCAQGNVSRVIWDYKIDGDTFTGVATTGLNFTTRMNPDGSVRVTYEAPLGASLLTGNAKTRQLEIWNEKFSCRYRLVALQ